MEQSSRRAMLGATPGGSAALLAATAAHAQGAPPLPQPLGKGVGADIIGPRNKPLDRQNPGIIAPPRTDHGSIPNLKWSFADSHMRLEQGGWARETTINELPVSTEMAGVNMRLDAGAIRELHWHKATE